MDETTRRGSELSQPNNKQDWLRILAMDTDSGMDDIKLYAKSKRDIDSLIDTTRIYSSDIGMSFGLEKCGRMVTKRGKVIHTEGVSLPEGTIADIEDSYKYLGIPQVNGNLEQATKKAATAKYLQRVRQVLRSQLNAKNKSRVINSYVLPVIRYPAGIIRWPKEEIQTTNVKTQSSSPCMEGSTPNPAPGDCTLAARKEAED
ncbi:5,10-methenyltetrahydrofolate synthetase (5-formyltetrahydrofolate cyclo-ligase) isoform X2 [Betta splendens]|uniref:5,10-methenyltetrahydrofolate synthetase (5-formyltetrahydrofolate cyclo-ligase) isoform X2 n=1 Tax=Betta splendens TaxID=158456 RepID=A0A9W2XC57_BETSP|nr:5,10-methenyltetrahydrofolate synthetase (5-formyltetrahydrofolate cyclo-ligase) isoform X2 [Betta splendens]XP_055359273.1 5,10-methenyltetrahydrofolate synthetase (5-formyltetrahydrofolate cyclo-ligase) isoform X2 [Betta splendens]